MICFLLSCSYLNISFSHTIYKLVIIAYRKIIFSYYNLICYHLNESLHSVTDNCIGSSWNFPHLHEIINYMHIICWVNIFCQLTPVDFCLFSFFKECMLMSSTVIMNLLGVFFFFFLMYYSVTIRHKKPHWL